SRALCGRVDVVDLGLPVPGTAPIAAPPPHPAAGTAAGAAVGSSGTAGTADVVLAGHLHVPGDRDHKYTRGVVEVWAGSEAYPGAAVLTCTAACRAGAGMVRLAAPRRVEDLVLAHRPETVPAPGRHQALVVGPGTDPDDETRATGLRRVLRTLMPATPPHRAPAAEGSRGRAPLPAVIDAGALPL
ncbi:NAD(P)H-hydrate dehydratase, partial [Actinomyces sp. 187325]